MMKKQNRVSVVDGKTKLVIARVRYNQDLDFWDGRSFSCGEAGKHKGLTKLQDGRYVLIRGSQLEGETHSAHIISKKEALKEIIKSNDLRLLKFKKFIELNKMYEKQLKKEKASIQTEEDV